MSECPQFGTFAKIMYPLISMSMFVGFGLISNTLTEYPLIQVQFVKDMDETLRKVFAYVAFGISMLSFLVFLFFMFAITSSLECMDTLRYGPEY